MKSFKYLNILIYLVYFLILHVLKIEKVNMKKNQIIIVLALIIPFISHAQDKGVKVKWYSIDEAMKLNKEHPRKILIDVYTDWCGWCKKMDSETFSHPVIAQYLNEHYYPVKFNAESSDSVEFGGHTFVNEGSGSRSTHQFAIALLQGKMSYPSIAYLNEDLQLIAAIPGYLTAPDIEPLLNYIATDQYENNVDLQKYSESFESKIGK